MGGLRKTHMWRVGDRGRLGPQRRTGDRSLIARGPRAASFLICEGIMKCAALTAFLPNLMGFPSPRGPLGSNVQLQACKRAPGRPEPTGRTTGTTSGGIGCPVTAATTCEPVVPSAHEPELRPQHAEFRRHLSAGAAASAAAGRVAAARGVPAAAGVVAAASVVATVMPAAARRSVVPAPGPPTAGARGASGASGGGRPPRPLLRAAMALRRRRAPGLATMISTTATTIPISMAMSIPPTVLVSRGPPLSRVEGGCPRLPDAKAHLSNSRGCPQDGGHDLHRTPSPQPPPRRVRDDDLRRDVRPRPARPAPSTWARASPTPTARPRCAEAAVARHPGRRTTSTRRAPAIPELRAADRRAPAALLRARPTTRTTRCWSPRAPPRRSPPPCWRCARSATRSSRSSRTTTPTRACVAMAGAARGSVTLRAARLLRPDLDALRGRDHARRPGCCCSTRRTTRPARCSPRDELAAIARLCVEHDLLAVTDEVYEHLVFDGAAHPARHLAGHARAHGDHLVGRQDVLVHRLEGRLGLRARRAGRRPSAPPSSS